VTGGGRALTPDLVLDSLRLAASGRVFDLSHHLSPGSPRLSEQTPYVSSLQLNPGTGRAWYAAQGATNGVAFAEERVELSFHTGTHLDALGHVWENDMTFDETSLSEGVDIWGLSRFGVETVPPIITRGVLLDMPKYLNRSLFAGDVISPEDLEGALTAIDLELHVGDVILIRTGWSQYYEVDNATYLGGWPGIGLRGAKWLAEQGVVAIGSDTMGLEVEPGEHSDILYPVHAFMLVQSGTYIIEQANLDEIAEEGITQFLCLCLPPKFKGGTGAPIRLVAVV
jgi:kynurenine formamidase